MHHLVLVACVVSALAGCGGSRAAAPAGVAGNDDPSAPDLLTSEPESPPDLGGAGDGSDGGAAPDDGGGQGPVPNGTAVIMGKMNGYEVTTIKSVVAVVTGQSFNVYIADRADLCTIMQMKSSPMGTSIFRLGSTAGAGPHTFPAGSYTYPSGAGSGTGGGNGGGGMGGGGAGGTGNGMGTRNAVIERSDDRCLFSGYNQAATGSFTITADVAPNATEISGTFDITFDVISQKGRFTGSFKAPVCPNALDIPYTPVYCE